MMWAVVVFAISILRSLLALFRSRRHQAVVELALRQQLAIYVHRHPRPHLSPLDRAFWVALSRFWPRWRSALVVVRPETVIRWHRAGFRRYWRSISVPGPGRPPISEEAKNLIVRMATENHWRARKIQAELSKLGIAVSLTTISRYLPKPRPDPGSQQRWITFLRNHRDVIAGMDFFVVPTVRFQLLYVWFAIDHGRRRVLHFNVTANPAAHWVIQQLRDAFPNEPAHRFLIFDNDAIFSAEVAGSIAGFGSIKSDCLAQVIPIGEGHLRRMVREYVEHYHAERNHQGIRNRLIEADGTRGSGSIECRERLGGLLRYYCRAA